jgi:hypothetical protein
MFPGFRSFFGLESVLSGYNYYCGLNYHKSAEQTFFSFRLINIYNIMEGNMGFLRERVSYLKGLSEGMKIDENTNEGKLLMAIIDVIDDIALAVEDLEEIQDEQAELIESIDNDLAEVEYVIFDDENYYDDDDDDSDDDYDYDDHRHHRHYHFKHRHFDFGDNINSCNCGFHDTDDEEDDEDEEGNSCYYQVECPYCYGIINPDKSMFDEEGKNIECPHCHKKIQVEWVCDCDEEDCECEDYEDETYADENDHGDDDKE